jgi:hypothetical protein
LKAGTAWTAAQPLRFAHGAQRRSSPCQLAQRLLLLLCCLLLRRLRLLLLPRRLLLLP